MLCLNTVSTAAFQFIPVLGPLLGVDTLQGVHKIKEDCT